MNEQKNTPETNIASRPKRLAAALLDGFSGMLVSTPVFTHFGFWEAVKNQTPLPDNVSHGLTLFSLAVFFLLHGYLLHRYGQTLGKRIMGLAIVSLDGKKLPFGQLILTRYVPQWMVGMLPVIGPLVAFADVLFIFSSPQNRCLHDLIAKTQVIDLSIKLPESQKPNSFIA